VFEVAGTPAAALALWRPRFRAAARGFVDWERSRHDRVAASHLEKKGSLKLGDFELIGVADRIDILKNGTAAILDYKTGATPTLKQVNQLLSPQLPLEAAILAQDGFGIGGLVAEELIYLSLASERREAVDIDRTGARGDGQLIAASPGIGPSHALSVTGAPYRADIAGDYDHLARVQEWSPSGWTEEADARSLHHRL
jgi:ATP-dependent helicase/nuclease subunit B